MNILCNKTLNNVIKTLCIAAVLVMILVAVTLYKADVSTLLVFLVFMVFYVQLPGLFILRMMRIELNHISTTLAMGLFTGWAFVILQYFITDFIHTNILLYVLGPICSILYIVARWLNRKCDRHYTFSFSRLSTALCIFIVLALLYSLLNTQYMYMSPAVSDYTYMNPDKAYHMGLINSLSHDFPLESPWVKGRTINYHIFTEMLYSVPVRIFGLTSDKLLLTCGPYLTVYAFGLSLYSLFKEFSGKSKRAGLYCLAVLLSNIYITRSLTESLALFFVLKNENAVAYGISATMVFIILFRYWYNRYSAGEKSWHFLILMTAMIMLLTGIKGPMGLVMIGALWGTFLIGLILRRVKFRAVLPLILLSVAFFVIYVLILGSKGQTNGGGNSIIAFATIANIAFYRAPLVALMKSWGLPKIIRLAVMLVVFMVFLFTAFIVPFTVGYIRELYLVFSRKRDFDFARVAIYAACFVGLVCMFCLNYSGHSQVYFGFVSVFFAPLIAIWFLEDIESNKGFWSRLVKIVFFVALALTTVTLAVSYNSHIREAKGFLDTHRNYDTYLGISKEEYEAMDWLRLNTPEDSLLATDRYYSVPLEEYSYQDRWTNRFFLYAVYSNRFCYIAGSGYNFPAGDWVIRRDMLQTNAKLYDPDNVNRGKLANKLGVDYVVVSKRFTNLPDLSGHGYKLCYSNKHIDIYKIEK